MILFIFDIIKFFLVDTTTHYRNKYIENTAKEQQEQLYLRSNDVLVGHTVKECKKYHGADIKNIIGYGSYNSKATVCICI